jgi:hypothetical protein
MSAADRLRERLEQATALAAGVSIAVSGDLDFLDPQRLRRSLEAPLGAAAGRVRVAGTLDRRLAFIERLDGRWAAADLSGAPHGSRAWPQWAPAAPGDQQARVLFQQHGLVPRGEAAAGDHQRRLRKLVHDVQQARQQVMLAERRRDSQDVRDLGRQLAGELREGQAELHVAQPDGAQQSGPGGTGHVADAQGEARHREVLRVVQGCQLDVGAAQPVDGVIVQRRQRQPRAGVIQPQVPVGSMTTTTSSPASSSSLAKRAPGYTSLGFPDPRKLPYTPSASTRRPAQPQGPAP